MAPWALVVTFPKFPTKVIFYIIIKHWQINKEKRTTILAWCNGVKPSSLCEFGFAPSKSSRSTENQIGKVFPRKKKTQCPKHSQKFFLFEVSHENSQNTERRTNIKLLENFDQVEMLHKILFPFWNKFFTFEFHFFSPNITITNYSFPVDTLIGKRI